MQTYVNILALIVEIVYHLYVMNRIYDKRVRKFLHGEWAILGIGNTLRADDSFGAILAKELKTKLHGKPVSNRIFHAGISPENFVGKLAKMHIDKLLIFDAVIFNGSPGEIKLFTPDELSAPFALSHGPSNFKMIKLILPDADILILAVQPKSTKFGAKISTEVDTVIDNLTSYFLKILDDV